MISIALYSVLVGGGASLIRASLMGGLSILATLFGRRQTGVNTLAFTAFIINKWAFPRSLLRDCLTKPVPKGETP